MGVKNVRYYLKVSEITSFRQEVNFDNVNRKYHPEEALRIYKVDYHSWISQNLLFSWLSKCFRPDKSALTKTRSITSRRTRTKAKRLYDFNVFQKVAVRRVTKRDKNGPRFGNCY